MNISRQTVPKWGKIPLVLCLQCFCDFHLSFVNLLISKVNFLLNFLMINQANVRSAHYLIKTSIVSYLHRWFNIFSFCKCATCHKKFSRLITFSLYLKKKKSFVLFLLSCCYFQFLENKTFLFIEICVLVQDNTASKLHLLGHNKLPKWSFFKCLLWKSLRNFILFSLFSRTWPQALSPFFFWQTFVSFFRFFFFWWEWVWAKSALF